MKWQQEDLELLGLRKGKLFLQNNTKIALIILTGTKMKK